MKPPDDMLARKARLRREHIEAFMRGDEETWMRTGRELEQTLRTEGMPRFRTYTKWWRPKKKKKA